MSVLAIFQSDTQEVETQTEDNGGTGEQARGHAPNDRRFADGQIIVKLEAGATQADLTALNQRNGARTEEALPVGASTLPEHWVSGRPNSASF